MQDCRVLRASEQERFPHETPRAKSARFRNKLVQDTTSSRIMAKTRQPDFTQFQTTVAGFTGRVVMSRFSEEIRSNPSGGYLQRDIVSSSRPRHFVSAVRMHALLKQEKKRRQRKEHEGGEMLPVLLWECSTCTQGSTPTRDENEAIRSHERVAARPPHPLSPHVQSLARSRPKSYRRPSRKKKKKDTLLSFLMYGHEVQGKHVRKKGRQHAVQEVTHQAPSVCLSLSLLVSPVSPIPFPLSVSLSPLFPR